MKQLQVASFFSGIGGFDIGFEKAGFKINFQCEIQPFCEAVLKRSWPDTSFAKDITTLDPKSIPVADVWCGGFPCQDLSVARGAMGRHGLNGSRSSLFFSLAKLAQIKKPRVILIENVHGLLNSNQGRDFAELLYTLDALNYAVSWRLLNSRYFGVPQSRPRVYICAWLNDFTAAGNVLFENHPPTQGKKERSAFMETSWIRGPGPIAPKLAFCLAATSGRHTGTDWSRTYIAYENDVRRLTPLECERLQGFPDDWTKIIQSLTDFERADSLRYHALGNAVSVPVVKWIATRIRDQLQNSCKTSRNKNSRLSILKESVQKWPGLHGPDLTSEDLEAIRKSREKIAWPNAGVLWKGVFVANHTPPSLNKPVSSDLLDLIERNRPDRRYFLSPNAAEGILRRVDSQGRHLFPPLRSSLEKLSGQTPRVYKSTKQSSQDTLHFTGLECVLP